MRASEENVFEPKISWLSQIKTVSCLRFWIGSKYERLKFAKVGDYDNNKP